MKLAKYRIIQNLFWRNTDFPKKYVASLVTVEESSDHLENMWPSRIYPWRFPKQLYSSVTTNGLVHDGRSHRHRRRHRNNLSSGLWYVNLGDYSTSRLQWIFLGWAVSLLLFRLLTTVTTSRGLFASRSWPSWRS